MKHYLLVILTSILLLNCDSKKTSIAGTVVNKTTGEGVSNVLVSYVSVKKTAKTVRR